MNTSNLFKIWAALVIVISPFFAIAGPPDTTLLDDLQKRSRKEFAEFGRWRTNRPAEMRSWANQAVVTVISNPPGGIGLVIGNAPGGAFVKRAVAGTPAWRAGLREGDLVTAIGTQATAGIALKDIALRLRGQVGSELDLTLRRPGQGQVFTVRIRREVVLPPLDGFQL